MTTVFLQNDTMNPIEFLHLHLVLTMVIAEFELCVKLCPNCKESHDKSHCIVDYEQKMFYCDIHSTVEV